MAEAFWEKYKHPKWQEKRLRILERAEFECEHCGSDSKTLNVHHGHYAKGKDPWDYEDETLHCLCEPCHKQVSEKMATIRRFMAMVKTEDLDYLIGFMGAFARCSCFHEDLDVQIEGINSEVIRGVADCFSVSPEFVEPLVQDGRLKPEDVEWKQIDEFRASRQVAVAGVPSTG